MCALIFANLCSRIEPRELLPCCSMCTRSGRQMASWVTKHYAAISWSGPSLRSGAAQGGRSERGGLPLGDHQPIGSRKTFHRATPSFSHSLAFFSTGVESAKGLRVTGGQREGGNSAAYFPLAKHITHCVCRCLRCCLPDGVERPGRLNRRGHSRAGAHQHGTVDVGCHHQDAKQNRPNDGPLQTQIVRSACHS